MTGISLSQCWYRLLSQLWENCPFPWKTSQENVLNLPVGVTAPHQKYIRGWVGARLNLKPWLRHFAHPFPNFYRGEKWEIWPRFRPQSTLKHSDFDTKQHVWNLKGAFGAPMSSPSLMYVASLSSEKKHLAFADMAAQCCAMPYQQKLSASFQNEWMVRNAIFAAERGYLSLTHSFSITSTNITINHTLSKSRFIGLRFLCFRQYGTSVNHCGVIGLQMYRIRWNNAQ